MNLQGQSNDFFAAMRTVDVNSLTVKQEVIEAESEVSVTQLTEDSPEYLASPVTGTIINGSDWFKSLQLQSPSKSVYQANKQQREESANKQNKESKSELAVQLSRLYLRDRSAVRRWNHKESKPSALQIWKSIQLKVIGYESLYSLQLVKCVLCKKNDAGQIGTDLKISSQGLTKKGGIPPCKKSPDEGNLDQRLVMFPVSQSKQLNLKIGSIFKIFPPWQELELNDGQQILLCTKYCLVEHQPKITRPASSISDDDKVMNIVTATWNCPCVQGLNSSPTICPAHHFPFTVGQFQVTVPTQRRTTTQGNDSNANLLQSVNNSPTSHLFSVSTKPCNPTVVVTKICAKKSDKFDSLLKSIESCRTSGKGRTGSYSGMVSFSGHVHRAVTVRDGSSKTRCHLLVEDICGSICEIQLSAKSLNKAGFTLNSFENNTVKFSGLKVHERVMRDKNEKLFTMVDRVWSGKGVTKSQNKSKSKTLLGRTAKPPSFCYILQEKDMSQFTVEKSSSDILLCKSPEYIQLSEVLKSKATRRIACVVKLFYIHIKENMTVLHVTDYSLDSPQSYTMIQVSNACNCYDKVSTLSERVILILRDLFLRKGELHADEYTGISLPSDMLHIDTSLNRHIRKIQQMSTDSTENHTGVTDDALWIIKDEPVDCLNTDNTAASPIKQSVRIYGNLGDPNHDKEIFGNNMSDPDLRLQVRNIEPRDVAACMSEEDPDDNDAVNSIGTGDFDTEIGDLGTGTGVNDSENYKTVTSVNDTGAGVNETGNNNTGTGVNDTENYNIGTGVNVTENYNIGPGINDTGNYYRRTGVNDTGNFITRTGVNDTGAGVNDMGTGVNDTGNCNTEIGIYDTGNCFTGTDVYLTGTGVNDKGNYKTGRGENDTRTDLSNTGTDVDTGAEFDDTETGEDFDTEIGECQTSEENTVVFGEVADISHGFFKLFTEFKLVDSTDEASILIVPANSNGCTRFTALKLFECLVGRKTQIISNQWIKDSLREGEVQDMDTYKVKSADHFGKFSASEQYRKFNFQIKGQHLDDMRLLLKKMGGTEVLTATKETIIVCADGEISTSKQCVPKTWVYQCIIDGKMNSLPKSYNNDSDENDTSEMVGINSLEVQKKIQVQTASNAKGKKVQKKQACIYCGALCTKLSRHLALKHTAETDVAKIVKLGKNSIERKHAWMKLAAKGNFAHNQRVKEQGSGFIIPKKRPVRSTANSKYLPCEFCLAYIIDSDMWRHHKSCISRPKDVKSDGAIHNSRLLLPTQCSEQLYKHVVSKLQEDYITSRVKADALILDFGQRLYNKTTKDKPYHKIIGQKLRELARCVIAIHEQDNTVTTLSDVLNVTKWQVLAESVKKEAGFDMEKNVFTKPSFAISCGKSLRRCVKILQSKFIVNGDELSRERVEQFLKMFEGEWNKVVLAGARESLDARKCNKVKLLPLVEDVTKLLKHIDTEVDKVKISNNMSANKEAYARMCKLTLAQIFLFNRTRGFETQNLTKEDFSKASLYPLVEEEVKCCLSKFERELCTSHIRVETTVKHGRKVTLLFTPAMVKNVAMILNLHKSLGCSSMYIFKPIMGSTTYRGTQALREISKEAKLTYFYKITSSGLRKQLATLTQVVCLSENSQDILAKFIGHDCNINGLSTSNCSSHGIMEVAKLSRLIHLMNSGKISRADVETLEDIDVNCTLEDESESDDEDASIVGSTSSSGNDNTIVGLVQAPSNDDSNVGSLATPTNDVTNVFLVPTLSNDETNVDLVPTLSNDETNVFLVPTLSNDETNVDLVLAPGDDTNFDLVPSSGNDTNVGLSLMLTNDDTNVGLAQTSTNDDINLSFTPTSSVGGTSESTRQISVQGNTNTAGSILTLSKDNTDNVGSKSTSDEVKVSSFGFAQLSSKDKTFFVESAVNLVKDDIVNLDSVQTSAKGNTSDDCSTATLSRAFADNFDSTPTTAEDNTEDVSTSFKAKDNTSYLGSLPTSSNDNINSASTSSEDKTNNIGSSLTSAHNYTSYVDSTTNSFKDSTSNVGFTSTLSKDNTSTVGSTSAVAEDNMSYVSSTSTSAKKLGQKRSLVNQDEIDDDTDETCQPSLAKRKSRGKQKLIDWDEVDFEDDSTDETWQPPVEKKCSSLVLECSSSSDSDFDTDDMDDLDDLDDQTTNTIVQNDKNGSSDCVATDNMPEMPFDIKNKSYESILKDSMEWEDLTSGTDYDSDFDMTDDDQLSDSCWSSDDGEQSEGNIPMTGSNASVITEVGSNPSDKATSSEMTSTGVKIQFTLHKDGKRIYDKLHFCLFCGAGKTYLRRHYFTYHKTEPDVKEILDLPLNSSERKLKLLKLQNTGDFKHNTEVLEKGEGIFVTSNRHSNATSPEDFLPCTSCLGFYVKEGLWRHRKKCPFTKNVKKSRRIQSEASLFLHSSVPVSDGLKVNVLAKMAGDEVTKVVHQDKLIVKLGEKLYSKHRNFPHLYNHVSQKMRELARLLISTRQNDTDITSLYDLISSEKFPIVVEATKSLCSYNKDSNKFGKPCLALKIGQILKKCARIYKKESYSFGNIDQMKQAEEFLSLCENEWTEEISSLARQTLSTNKVKKDEMLPLSQDLVKLQLFFQTKNESLRKSLEESFSKSDWELLNQISLAQLVLYNRRRGGEAQRITLEDYTTGKKSEAPSKEVEDFLSSTEKALMETLSRVEICGKYGRTVPILLHRSIEKNIDLLLKWRSQAGVHEDNRFLFARPNYDAMTSLRSSDVLRKFAKEAQLTAPQNIRSIKLSKHVATLYQILNMEEKDLEILASFMDKDLIMQRLFNCLPQGTLQVSRIGLLLTEFNSKDNGKSTDNNEFNKNDDLSKVNDGTKEDGTKDDVENIDINECLDDSENGRPEHSTDCSKAATSDVTVRSKYRKVEIQKLTEEQSSLLKDLFESNVRLRRELKMADCERVIRKYPVLKNLGWKKVKNTVHNWITAEKRKMKNLVA